MKLTNKELVIIIYDVLAMGPPITPDTLKFKAQQIADAIKKEEEGK